MIVPKVGFIVYGVHKDGLKDPMGVPFIDDELIENAKKSLREKGLELVDHDLVIATKKEAKDAFKKMKDSDVDCVVLFSGTWVWAAHLIAAIRDFAATGKGIVIWTNSGSQGWRPVGGLVMHGALMEVGIKHKFVYGSWENPGEIDRIVSYCKASYMKSWLNMSTLGVFGGRGMGQTCGAADPSQWMKKFGIDIDSRDTTQLIRKAQSISKERIKALEPRITELFGSLLEKSDATERSIRLYLALKDMVDEEGFDFYSIQSFPGLGDDYAASCFAQSMMLEDGIGTSTLGDMNTALTVLLLTKLSRERVYYGDLQHINKDNNEIKIIGDGAVPPSLGSSVESASFAEHGIPTEGQAGGLAVKLVCKEGEGVLARLGRVNGEFQMVITRCAVKVPPVEELGARKLECGIPFWPHAFVTAHCNIEELLKHWTNEYACLGYGEELYDTLIDFCELTGIKPILP